jgi:hypothetical protein
MRKSISILVVVLIATMVGMSSCGSPKKTAGGDYGEKMEKEECIVYAEDPNATGLRAWGEARDFNMSDASRQAALIARGNLSISIATLIKDGVKRYNDTYGKAVSDGIVAKGVLEGGSVYESGIAGAAKELLRGSKVVKSTFYKQSDGTIRAFACVEVDVKSIADYVKQSTELKSVIAEAEKLKIHENSEKFDDSMQDIFDEHKEAKTKNQ